MLDGALVYRESFFAGLRPDPLLTVSEWADEHRLLSQKASAEPGRWRTDRTPYLREIMDTLSPSSPIQSVVFMKGAQVGGTEAGNNWMGYVVHNTPGPMMLVQPSLDIAKRLSKQRIAPMIEEMPVLRELIAPSRERDSGNTMLVKEFPGGVLIMTGANSAAGLRSMPVRFLFLDEIDAYPSDIDGEGDPVKLAEKRTTTFVRKKIFKVSTPTIKDMSRVEKEYEASDKRRYFVPCPHCGNMDWMRWKNIKWENSDPTTAALACEGCGTLIEERYKTSMLAKGEWRATCEGDGKTAGFHLSSLYSPIGWKSWADIVAEWLEAKGDPPLLKTFVNTVLAETWEEEYSARVGADGLAERCEEYELMSVPAGGLVLTAGVDVQDNRIEVVVRAWGKDEESWLVNYVQIYGDPSKQEIWNQVDNLLLQEYKHSNGKKMKARVAMLDSGGHFTHEVYVFCRPRRKRNVLAGKGQSQPGKPAIGKPTRQDINYRSQTLKRGVELWPIGTDTIKSVIYGRLKNSDPAGAGIYHWPIGLTNEYFKQLTAEKQVTNYVNGFAKRIWKKKDGARNEALDCEVYAYAALQYLYTRVNRATIWQQLEKILHGEIQAKEEDTPDSEPNSPANNPRKIVRPGRRGGNFVKSW
ncbi:MAG: phage terminase large subunit family protein [Alphaproteobacteria bacterium]|nr:phage terminase large subunit family protein [Alphaproteobacteria bacterium]